MSETLSAEAITFVPKRGLLPEDAEYRDTGCDLSPSCLSCHLPQCRYDPAVQPHVMASFSRQRKAVIMVKAGVDVDGIAALLGVSRRQVFRYLETRLV